MNNETLSAINARIQRAVELIESGDVVAAKGILQRMSATMPKPEYRHLKSIKKVV